MPVVRTPIAEASVQVIRNLHLHPGAIEDFDVAVTDSRGETPIGVHLPLDEACDLAMGYGCEHGLHVWVRGEPYFAPGGVF